VAPFTGSQKKGKESLPLERKSHALWSCLLVITLFLYKRQAEHNKKHDRRSFSEKNRLY
jgi:hypothetical protein